MTTITNRVRHKLFPHVAPSVAYGFQPRRGLPVTILPPFGREMSVEHEVLSIAFPKLEFSWELGPVAPCRETKLKTQVVKSFRPDIVRNVPESGLDDTAFKVLDKIHHIPYRICFLMTSEQDWTNLLGYTLCPQDRQFLSRRPITLALPCITTSYVDPDIVNSEMSRFFDAIGPFPDVTVKLPPSTTQSHMQELLHIGVRSFHFCNTLQFSALSLPAFLPFSLLMLGQLYRAAERVDIPHHEIDVTTGGNFDKWESAIECIQHGANAVSVQSLWKEPFRTFILLCGLNDNVHSK